MKIKFWWFLTQLTQVAAHWKKKCFVGYFFGKNIHSVGWITLLQKWGHANITVLLLVIKSATRETANKWPRFHYKNGYSGESEAPTANSWLNYFLKEHYYFHETMVLSYLLRILSIYCNVWKYENSLKNDFITL